MEDFKKRFLPRTLVQEMRRNLLSTLVLKYFSKHHDFHVNLSLGKTSKSFSSLLVFEFLATIGNFLGYFIKFDGAWIVQLLVTFPRIFVELNLSSRLLKNMLIKWVDTTFTYLLDYSKHNI